MGLRRARCFFHRRETENEQAVAGARRGLGGQEIRGRLFEYDSDLPAALVVTREFRPVPLGGESRGDRPGYHLDHRYGVDTPQFARDMGQLLGPPLVGGNRITTLVNGDQIFPAMLRALAGARHSITFETFIYWSGTIGSQFADALAERAGAGVPVHIIVDWVGGSRMESRYLEQLESAGAQVVRYHPLTWHTVDRINNRTHRQLQVVDGRIGFTGGVGIADQWLGDAGDPDHWRETHYQVEGPVAGQLQAAFMDNWLQTKPLLLQGEGLLSRTGPGRNEHRPGVQELVSRGQRVGAPDVLDVFRGRRAIDPDRERLFPA